MPTLLETRLRELIRRHAAPLRLYACQWTEDADDVVQEAFVELAQQDPPPRNEVAWLYSLVRHKSLNAVRAERRRRDHHRRASVGRAEWFIPQDTAELRETRQQLLRLVPLRREIVIARIWGGLKFSEIAQVTGCPLTTVHRHYSQALAQLAEWLEPNDAESRSNHECTT